jgi:D-alanyl-D-alanine carboxypeptidase/D-alanyl-D-alanine-endopeptidase (penicillin-binding protein 4)
LLAIDDPALFAASALLDALGRRGITVSGRAVASHHYADEPADTRPDGNPYVPTGQVELARRVSPPLVESLRIINKVSQNLQAELVLREVARVQRNEGSLEAGLEELKAFLAEAGIEESEYNLADGSGLSRLNLITPAAVIKILRYMYASEHRQEWLDLLPVGGEDGTLSWRFRGISEARRIRAKTGTLSHVGALSGYAESRQGDLVAFSILVNNYNGPSSEMRRLIDKICTLVIQ